MLPMEKRTNQKTASAGSIYSSQNKVFHRGCQFSGMPYQERKDDWISFFREMSARDVDSFADLTLGERRDVISHLQKRGVTLFNPFVPSDLRPWKKGDPDREVTPTRRPMQVTSDKYAMIRKVAAILADMKLPWEYADSIARDRFGVEVVEWLNAGDLHKVVQMLVIHQKRHQNRQTRR